jgi:intracellular sulfur oxidation DsrE/DsrF family protein
MMTDYDPNMFPNGRSGIWERGARRLGTGLLFAVLVGTQAFAEGTPSQPGLTIDIPAKISDAKVVFNISRPAFEGDEPTALSFLRVMSAQFREAGVKGRLIAVFHGGSGYMLLGDAAYNRARKWRGGNPYKDQIAELQALGVEFEECGKTMMDNHWTNRDMLPGVKINAGANFRIVELVQQGFVQLQP